MTELPHFAFPFARELGRKRSVNLLPNPRAATSIDGWTYNQNGVAARVLDGPHPDRQTSVEYTIASLPNGASYDIGSPLTIDLIERMPDWRRLRFRLALKLVSGDFSYNPNFIVYSWMRFDDPPGYGTTVGNYQWIGGPSSRQMSQLGVWHELDTRWPWLGDGSEGNPALPTGPGPWKVRVGVGVWNNTGAARTNLKLRITEAMIYVADDSRPYTDDYAPGTGKMKVTEQDELDEVMSCVQTLVRCPVGFRIERPDYGIPWPEYYGKVLPADALQTSLEEFEDRARITTDVTREGIGDARISVEVEVDSG